MENFSSAAFLFKMAFTAGMLYAYTDVSLGSQSMPTSSITLIESPCYSESGSFTSPVKAGKLDFSESCRSVRLDSDQCRIYGIRGPAMQAYTGVRLM